MQHRYPCQVQILLFIQNQQKDKTENPTTEKDDILDPLHNIADMLNIFSLTHDLK